jgi:hypothetical protein
VISSSMSIREGMMASFTCLDERLRRNWQSCWQNPHWQNYSWQHQNCVPFMISLNRYCLFLFEAQSLFSRKWRWVWHVWIKGWGGIDRVVDKTPHWN